MSRFTTLNVAEGQADRNCLGALHFARRDRIIKKENVAKIYSLFKGHTYFMQKTFNEAFSDTATGEECTLEMLRQAIDNMLEMNAPMYREALSGKGRLHFE